MSNPAKDPTLVVPLLRFSSKLFESLKHPNDNLIFSPLSVHVCLNMFSLGVTKGSETAKILSSALGYESLEDAQADKVHQINAQLVKMFRRDSPRNYGALLGMINYLITNNMPIKKDYLDESEKYYQTSVKEIRGKSDIKRVIGEIDEWCSKAGLSEGFLQESDLEDPFDLPRSVLINALRVESHWFKKFFKTNAIFHNQGCQDDRQKLPLGLGLHDEHVIFFELTKQVDSRHRAINLTVRDKNPESYDRLSEFEFRVISVKLEGGVTYVIIEPLKTVDRTELATLEGNLMQTQPDGSSNLSHLNNLIDEANSVLANLTMPGFKYEQDINLEKPMSAIGLERLFDDATLQDTRQITQCGLRVSKMQQRAFIDVNENGIKAAAITKMVMTANCLQRERPIEIKVENPFVFVLRLNSLPLFLGHYVHC